MVVAKLLLVLAALAGYAHAFPSNERKGARLQERLSSDIEALQDLVDLGAKDDGDEVQEDVEDAVVAKFTKGQYASCAEVKEAGMCDAKAAQAGCKATCAAVEADEVGEQKRHCPSGYTYKSCCRCRHHGGSYKKCYKPQCACCMYN